MSQKPSLEEMWKEIEDFGINRKSLDPNDVLTYDQVEELYLTIKEKKIEDEQVRILREELEKETGKIVHQTE